MIKALFFDLDGTLLNSQKQILPSSVAAIEKCRKKGVKIFISTARSPMLDKMLGWSEEIFSLFDGGAYCNGSVIKTEKLTRYHYINPSAAKAVTRIVNSYDNIHLALHLTDDKHAFNHYLPDDMLKPWGLERDAILPLEENSFLQTAKIIIYNNYLVDSDCALPSQLYDSIINSVCENTNIYLQDKGKTIQLAAKNISKLSAIKEICREYNFAEDEVAVFGDDVNDMEMLSAYPYSIAMGNAEESIKQLAKCVTHTNDDDGIAYALKHILKLI